MKANALVLALALAAPLAASRTVRAQANAAESRPTLAVMRFTGGSITRSTAQSAVGQGIADLLTTSLASRGDVRVVDRERLDAVLAEQRLVETNQVDASTAVRLGKVLGVRHIITGGYLVDGRNRLRFDVRAINVETSEIEFRETIEGKVDDLLSLVDQMEQRVSKSLGLSAVVRQAGRAAGANDSRRTQAKTLVDSLLRRAP